MANRELENSMLEVVDNQLSINEPKCTKDTFERLVTSGCSPQEAKESIAEVLLDRITASLSEGKAFDEADFGKRLARIKGKTKQHPATLAPSEKTMAELIDRIKCDPARIFPEAELTDILARKEEAIPLLLAFLEEVRDNAEKYSNEFDCFGHIYAVFLLAQFRVKEAYPIVLELFSLPDGLADKLFGDAVTDYAGRIMASVCGDDVAPLKQLANNEEADEYVRVEALTALAILTLHGQLERKELMAYYKELLPKIDNMTILTMLINLCTDIYPGEVYDEIKAAYESGKVDYLMIGMESVDHAMLEGQSPILARAEKNEHLQKIDDTIGELIGWAYFKNNRTPAKESYFDQLMNNDPGFMPKLKGTPVVNEPKIGRNDPCPCGSGKKYKKCCGK